jgi:hypothetical protein
LYRLFHLFNPETNQAITFTNILFPSKFLVFSVVFVFVCFVLCVCVCVFFNLYQFYDSTYFVSFVAGLVATAAVAAVVVVVVVVVVAVVVCATLPN